MTKKHVLSVAVIAVLLFLGVTVFERDGGEDFEALPLSGPETIVETPPSAPAKSSVAKKATVAYTQTRVLENGRYVSTVSLTATGFLPKVVEISVGETVRFINKSGAAMRIASDNFNNVPLYLGLNQEKSVGQNGTYELTFTEAGVWTYHNLGLMVLL